MLFMKIYLTLIAIFLLLIDCSSAQSLFVNAIGFKGQAEQNRFKGVDFDINYVDGMFTISQHKEGSKNYAIKRNDDSIQDLVFSSNRSAIAVAMRATDSNNQRRAIVTVNADGKHRVLNYESHKMTERLGWIVELGGVSNDGTHILAKCALMLPKNQDGVVYVRHEWTILKISDTSINIIASVDAIDKWHEYTLQKASAH